MPALPVKAVHVRIVGSVQGVGYRQACRSTARTLGLAGWVRNLGNGDVEVFAQGSAPDVDRLIDWLWAGPAMARVTGVETDVVAPDMTLADFFIQSLTIRGDVTPKGDDPPRTPRGPSARSRG